jgi:periplasmic protein TonB
MFNTLLESKARAQRSVGGSLVSVTLHASLIVLAIQATLNAGQPKEKPAADLTFVDVKKDEPPPPRRKAPTLPISPVIERSPSFTAPVNIPDELPVIDLPRKATEASDWLGKPISGDRGEGSAVGAPVANRTYLESEVEKPAMAAPGSPTPRYPDLLKLSGVEGGVIVSFVVDTAGRADVRSLTILKSTHELFAAAVRAALPGMRFIPAEAGGKKVRQLVLLPFAFNIIK